MLKIFRFDNTANIKNLASAVDISTPAGKEKFLFQVGQQVQSSETGVYKPGITFTISSRYMENGFAYYVDTKGRIHRNKDIRKNP